MKMFVVGGYVRDLLLDKSPNDSDYVITGSSIQEMELLGLRQVGADFPVFLHPIHNSELALARTERKISSGYLGFECNTNDVTLKDDLSRRDFSINALAIEVSKIDNEGLPLLDANGESIDKFSNVIDHFNGIRDLKNKVIRHIGPAFVEDPVRALRACRFAARYNFSIAPETVNLIRYMYITKELDSLVPERIWLEITKALSSDNPSEFFKHMYDLGIGKVIHNLYLDTFIKNLSGYSLEQQTVILGLSNIATGNIDAIANDIVFDIFEKLKVPNDCQEATRKFFKIKCLLVNSTPERFMKIVECLDLTHTRKWLYMLSPIVVDFFPDLHNNWDFVNSLLKIMDIGFDELSIKQKTELKGPAIAEAIRELRIKFIINKLEELK